jgi:hypothetical protein
MADDIKLIVRQCFSRTRYLLEAALSRWSSVVNAGGKTAETRRRRSSLAADPRVVV